MNLNIAGEGGVWLKSLVLASGLRALVSRNDTCMHASRQAAACCEAKGSPFPLGSRILPVGVAAHLGSSEM